MPNLDIKSLKQQTSDQVDNQVIDPQSDVSSSNKKAEKDLIRVFPQFTNVPRTTRMLKKDSLKDFCDMLDLTKSKLQTRRVLNKNDSNLNTNQSKAYLQAFATKKNAAEGVFPVNGEASKTFTNSRKNIVKLVSSELKNLTKLSKIDDGIGVKNNYFLNVNSSGCDNPLLVVDKQMIEDNVDYDNNWNNKDLDAAADVNFGVEMKNKSFFGVNFNLNSNKDNNSVGDFNNFKTKNSSLSISNKLISPNSIDIISQKNYKKNFESNSSNADDIENSISGRNSYNTNNTNSTNNLTNMIFNGTVNNPNWLMTPGTDSTKNNSILRRSLFDKSPSPNNVGLGKDITLLNKNNINNNHINRKLLSEELSNKNFSELILNKEMDKLKLNSENKKTSGEEEENNLTATDLNNSLLNSNMQSMDKSAYKITTNFDSNNYNNSNNYGSNTSESFSRRKIFCLKKDSIEKFENYHNKQNEIFSSLCNNISTTNNEKVDNNNQPHIRSSKELSNEYYPDSIIILPEEKPSQKSEYSDFDAQVKNLDSKISSSNNKFPLSTHYSNNSLMQNLRHGCSSNLDSSLNSEITFQEISDSRRLNREESLVNEIDDEVDSQFDEMIELMDDIQLSDPYRETENDVMPIESKPNTIKITDFKLISIISKGGYGRVDLYKKTSTGDIYAIKTVDINKMVKNIN